MSSVDPGWGGSRRRRRDASKNRDAGREGNGGLRSILRWLEHQIASLTRCGGGARLLFVLKPSRELGVFFGWIGKGPIAGAGTPAASEPTKRWTPVAYGRPGVAYGRPAGAALTDLARLEPGAAARLAEVMAGVTAGPVVEPMSAGRRLTRVPDWSKAPEGERLGAGERRAQLTTGIEAKPAGPTGALTPGRYPGPSPPLPTGWRLGLPGAPPVDDRPADTVLADTALADTALADTALAETALAETALADTALADTARYRADIAPVDTALAGTQVVDAVPVDPAPVDIRPADTEPGETGRGKPRPGDDGTRARVRRIGSVARPAPTATDCTTGVVTGPRGAAPRRLRIVIRRLMRALAPALAAVAATPAFIVRAVCAPRRASLGPRPGAAERPRPPAE